MRSTTKEIICNIGCCIMYRDIEISNPTTPSTPSKGILKKPSPEPQKAVKNSPSFFFLNKQDVGGEYKKIIKSRKGDIIRKTKTREGTALIKSSLTSDEILPEIPLVFMKHKAIEDEFPLTPKAFTPFNMPAPARENMELYEMVTPENKRDFIPKL